MDETTYSTPELAEVGEFAADTLGGLLGHQFDWLRVYS
ncbi:lasso RiPP family leader peptide-containing protein [Saccharopolyspora sp. CA-218241]